MSPNLKGSLDWPFFTPHNLDTYILPWPHSHDNDDIVTSEMSTLLVVLMIYMHIMAELIF